MREILFRGKRTDNGEGLWRPTKDGLGMRHVFEELNRMYGDGFIKYK